MIARHAENSEVSPVAVFVAVAVMTWPTVVATANGVPKDALPAPSVGTFAEPRKTCPSPLPEESQAGLEKNSTRKVALAVESSVPRRSSCPHL